MFHLFNPFCFPPHQLGLLAMVYPLNASGLHIGSQHIKNHWQANMLGGLCFPFYQMWLEKVLESGLQVFPE